MTILHSTIYIMTAIWVQRKNIPLLKWIFKLIHKQLSHYFKHFTFTFRKQQHNYATRTCQNVCIPNVNHEFAKKSIQLIAPAAYNSTHGNIIHKCTLIVMLDFDLCKVLIYSYCTISNCFSCRRNIQWFWLLYLFPSMFSLLIIIIMFCVFFLLWLPSYCVIHAYCVLCAVPLGTVYKYTSITTAELCQSNIIMEIASFLLLIYTCLVMTGRLIVQTMMNSLNI